MATNSTASTRKRPRAAVDTTSPDALLHGNAVQQLAGVSGDTLRRWVVAGIFPPPMLRICGRPRWRCETVLDWLRDPLRQAA